jgi:serine/threonine-protein kinase
MADFPAPLLGLRLGGRYELRAFLGRGGSGDVYEAVDLRLDRSVAVKVLRPEAARDGRFLRLLRAEARVAARVAHHGIVTVYDAARDPRGPAFVVMELVPGESLARRLAAGRLSPRDATRIAVSLADALAHAHQRDVTHGDVAPANVIVLRDGTAKLLDFGVARDAGGATPASRATLAYAAPEVLQGEPSGPGADVFGVGALLREMILGRPDADPGLLPAPLDRIVRACADPAPGRRYFAHALAEALRAAIPALGDTDPVLGRPTARPGTALLPTSRDLTRTAGLPPA